MYKKQVMLITGTRKGIGKYLAEYYVKKGFQVIGCSRGKIDFELNNYQHLCLDVSNEKDVKKMFSEIRKAYDRLDVLINNAGVNLSLSPVLLVPYKSALRTIEINLLGAFLMSREAAKIMMKKSFGRIINFSSMAVKHELMGEAIYTASKSAIISLTRVMAKEMNSYGITCNVIAPSVIKTDLIDSLSEDALKDIFKRNAIRKLCKTEDISNTIDWFIKRTSNSVTGQVVFLGGV